MYKFVKFYRILKNQATKLSFIFILTILFSFDLAAQNSDSIQYEPPIDSLIVNSATNVPEKEPDLKDIINYDAVDSIYFDVTGQKATMYGKAHVDYEDITLDAPLIVMDLRTHSMEARARLDSNGKVLEWPMMKQGDEEIQAKLIKFNTETKRGYIEDFYTQKDDGYLYTSQAYLDSNKTMYLQKASYTTCNLIEPHFHFRLGKAKMIPNERVIAKNVNLYIDSIPTPLWIPFAVLPLKSQRTSGIVLPVYNWIGSVFVLNNLGYFHAFNDSLTANFSTNLYSSGSYDASVGLNYKIRYQYQGNIRAQHSRILTNADEFDKSIQTLFEFDWNHRTDATKKRSLIADVHYETSRSNQLNFLNPQDFSVPQTNSAVALRLPLEGLPFDARINLKHNQIKNNTNPDEPGVNIFNLPEFTLGYTGARNPFKKIPYGKKRSAFRTQFLDQFAITHTTSGISRLSTQRLSNPSPLNNSSVFNANFSNDPINPNDARDFELTARDLPEIFRRNKYSMTHSSSLSNNIKIKTFTLTPRVNYSENWYFSRQDITLNSADSTVVGREDRGFYRVGRASYDATLSTTVYNFFNFGLNKTRTDSLGNEKILDRRVKIRQTISPRMSFTASPDYSEDSRVIQSTDNTLTQEEFNFNRFARYGVTPSLGSRRRSLGFSMGNVFEMKLPDKLDEQDPKKAQRKVIQLLSLNASTNYNMAADSLKLSNINFNASNSSLLGGALNFTVQANLDPYAYAAVENTNGSTSDVQTDTYWLAQNAGLARLTSFRLNAGGRFSPETFRNKNKKAGQPKSTSNPSIEGYDPFSLPWSLNVNYSQSWSQSTPNADTLKTKNISFNGRIALSPKWAATGAVSYSIDDKLFDAPNIGLERDLHCWVMRFNWTPFGVAQGYSFYIGVNTGTLSDFLNWEKRPVGSQRARAGF